MGKKLARAPVYFAIIQIRFNPITTLHKHIPDIQERFRQAGYPDFAIMQNAQLNLPMQAQMAQSLEAASETTPARMPSIETSSEFLFGRADRTASFLLQQSALTLQMTRYDRFETASGLILQGVGIVHDVLGLSFIEQVGFRYLNAITPDEGSDLEAYVHPYILGLSKPYNTQQVFSESVFHFDSVRVLSRSIVRRSALAFPADLTPFNMKIDSRFTGWVAPHVILDIDGVVSERVDYDVEAISKRLGLTHEALARVFEASVTPEALAAWDRSADADAIGKN